MTEEELDERLGIPKRKSEFEERLSMTKDIKEVKELLYRLEDITALGVSLPLVAYQQMKQHLPKLESEDPALQRISKRYADFIRGNEYDYNDHDERALSRAFKRLKKANPDLLHEYRTYVTNFILIGRLTTDF